MAEERVLGYLSQRFATSEENVATEALIWILRQSAAARAAVIRLAQAAGAPVPDQLHWTGQATRGDLGRPDVAGVDDQQLDRILIEAKFAAELTPRQPGDYLKLLPPGQPGALVVVAPTVRLASLWFELLRKIPALAASAPSPSAAFPGGIQVAAVNAHHVMAIIAWRQLVENIRDALAAAGESRLVQDAEQLLALTEAMDEAAYAPVAPGDYGPRAARQIQQLQMVIDDAWAHAIQAKVLERNGNSSHGRIFYGWYVRAAVARKSIWFGFLPRAWSRYGFSPLWVQIKTSAGWDLRRLSGALAPLDVADGPGVFVDEGSILIPLLLQPLLGQRDATADVQRQLERVAALLAAAVRPAEAPVEDDPLAPDASPPS